MYIKLVCILNMARPNTIKEHANHRCRYYRPNYISNVSEQSNYMLLDEGRKEVLMSRHIQKVPGQEIKRERLNSRASR